MNNPRRRVPGSSGRTAGSLNTSDMYNYESNDYIQNSINQQPLYMKQNNLGTTGLSLSQAQSYSNILNQLNAEIDTKVNNVNNSNQVMTLDGKEYVNRRALPLPENTVELLVQKGKNSAAIAFLMENMTAKANMLKDAQNKSFVYDEKFEGVLEVKALVGEDWGWAQLSSSEINEYTEHEAMASHLGQYFHRNGTLDRLRKELPLIKELEWLDVKKEGKTPMTSTVHHTAEQLMELHESLSALHRKHEQRVNYFKSKVKNLVTSQNADIAKENNLNRSKYNDLQSEYMNRRSAAMETFEKERQLKIKEIAKLRIQVDPRFQEVIDLVISKGGNKAEEESEA